MVWYEDRSGSFLYGGFLLRVAKWSLFACSLLIFSFSSQTGAQGHMEIAWEANVAELLELSREDQESFLLLDPAIKNGIYHKNYLMTTVGGSGNIPTMQRKSFVDM